MKVALAPCNYIGSFGDYTIPPDCNTDLEQQKAYVGERLYLNILHNQERLDVQKYGDAKIIRESNIET